MGVLIVGLVVFFAVHSVSIINRTWRDGMVAKMGLIPWQGLYAMVSLVGFALIVWGYGLARVEPVILYIPPLWLRHLALLLLLPVFPLLLATYLPGRIRSAAKHPMLVAIKLWALAHLLVNGALADVLLFGGFLAWAVVDRISVKRRVQTDVPTLPASKINDWIVILGGLGFYVVFVLWLHALLIGVPIIPR